VCHTLALPFTFFKKVAEGKRRNYYGNSKNFTMQKYTQSSKNPLKEEETTILKYIIIITLY
jgi:hypothetical protein